jgi:hypothetical protein
MEKPRKLPKHELVGTAYPVLQTLPSHVFEGIGKIIFSHGILENNVSELLFDIAQIDYSIGRIAFRYHAASERFKIVRRLMALHGLDAPPATPQSIERHQD